PQLVLVLEDVAGLDIDGVDLHDALCAVGDLAVSYQLANGGGSGMEQWWRPDRLAARRATLAARGRILAAVREFFTARGFVEVDTPALQVSPGLEPHLEAFATVLHDPRDRGLKPRFLHTSPEFAMKKLLVGGERRIWQLAHAFRDGERSATHHPEFAM